MRKLLGKSGGAIARPLLHAATLLLLISAAFFLFSPAFCHAQCNQPVITAVTPNTWVAEKTYNITISGSGFDPVNVSAGNCGVMVQATDGILGGYEPISISNITFVTQRRLLLPSRSTPANRPTQVSSSRQTALNYVDVGCDFGATSAPVLIIAGLSATITDTSDIMNGNVMVKLTAPSGTTGDLNLDFNGVDATSALELSQVPFTALAPGSQQLQLTFDTIRPGIYPMANGRWNAMLPGASTAQTVNVPDYTLPTPWTYFRKIFYTQYNVPHESACSGGDSDAWLVTTSVGKGKTTCNFTKIKLNSRFIAATWMNGTGVDRDGDSLKNAAAVNLGDSQGCAGQYPSGAIGHSKAVGNTFEVVSSVTGSCNTTLIADQSLARPCTQIGRQCPVAVLAGAKTLSCGDQLNLDSGDHTTASTRNADDLCPACSDSSTFHGADGHIDAFSSNPSCTGRAVGSLGFFYTSYPTN